MGYGIQIIEPNLTLPQGIPAAETPHSTFCTAREQMSLMQLSSSFALLEVNCFAFFFFLQDLFSILTLF